MCDRDVMCVDGVNERQGGGRGDRNDYGVLGIDKFHVTFFFGFITVVEMILRF